MIGDVIESKVDGAVEESGAAAITLKDKIHSALRELITNLINVIYGIFGINLY